MRTGQGKILESTQTDDITSPVARALMIDWSVLSVARRLQDHVSTERLHGLHPAGLLVRAPIVAYRCVIEQMPAAHFGACACQASLTYPCRHPFLQCDQRHAFTGSIFLKGLREAVEELIPKESPRDPSFAMGSTLKHSRQGYEPNANSDRTTVLDPDFHLVLGPPCV